MRLSGIFKLLFFAFLSFSVLAFADEPIRIAVTGFSSKVQSISESQLDSITGAFIHMLTETETLRVLERQEINALIREQNLSMSGLVSSETAVETGKLSGCQYILEGNISKRRSIILSVKVIDVKSGEIMFILSEQAESPKLSALLDSSSRLGNRIREQLTDEYAYVVTSNQNGEIIINRGNTALVQPESFYKIYNEWHELKKSDSDDIITNEETLHTEDIAVVQVVEVMEKFSVAKIVEGGKDPDITILRGDKAAPITKSEAETLIAMKNFTSRRHNILNRMTDYKIKNAEAGDHGQMVILGLMYYNAFGVKQDYKKAFEWWSRAAELKNTNAYMNLGSMYFEGKYVSQDSQKGLEWFLKAEEESHYYGFQEALGDVYMSGKGDIKQDYKKAFYWYSKAAEQGWADAQNQLASMYYYGLGVNKDYKKAFEFYMKAAEQNNSAGMYNIATMYLHGQGVEQNYKKAIEWYVKATEIGNQGAINNLGTMYLNGIGVEKNYKKALEYFSEAVEENNPTAFNQLGMMYLKGWGVKKDYKKAFEYFEKAYSLGFLASANQLGIMYEYGYGVEKDFNKAKELYKIAVKTYGSPASKYNLARIYKIESNYQEAMKFFIEAAKMGDIQSSIEVAEMYYNGEGVEKNFKSAFEWYLKAAEKNDSSSQNTVGVMYLKGEGVKIDYDKAEKWFKKSISGNPNNITVIINLGYTYELKGNIKKAQEYYHKAALKITSEDISIFRRLVSEGNNRSPKSFLKYFDEIFNK
ncbi:MAG: SEL1-like repeat protein [Synergistaceae bacterium]|nr:SEL1-like repeat protein [Synergistaceae bacterium]